MRSILLATAFAAVTAAVPVQAATLFSENFNSVAVGYYTAGQHVGQFTIQSNDVDVIGRPEFAYACPSPNSADGNHCVDLNGNANGTLVSDPLAVVAGRTYTVALKLAGNGPPSSPNATNPYTVDVTFAGLTRSFGVAPGASFANFSFDVTAGSALPVALVIKSTSQNQPTYWGAIVDDVTITSADPAPAAVPEPATWAMLLIGFGGIGAAARRRSTGAAAATA